MELWLFWGSFLRRKFSLSTAGNSMTTALRGPLRNHFWKKRRPQPYWGGENSGNALEASNALNYSAWGIPAVLSRGIPGTLWDRVLFKGGVTEGGGFHTRVRGTMFVRDGAVTPGPSRKCDITFFVKGRPKSARQLRDSTVAARSVQSVTVPSSRVSRERRSPGLRSPPL